MTIEEAIEHCYDQARNNKCVACASEHVQLGDWLRELVELRAIYAGLCK